MNIKKGAVSSNRNTLASYRKHYIPLESNPDLFTQLIHQLGVSPSLAFQDVLSINDPDLLAFIPRPALALILVFPTSDAYEVAKAKEEKMRDEYDGESGKEDGEEEEEPVMWFRQSINNACGLYAILHAISNGEARNYIRKFLLVPSFPPPHPTTPSRPRRFWLKGKERREEKRKKKLTTKPPFFQIFWIR